VIIVLFMRIFQCRSEMRQLNRWREGLNGLRGKSWIEISLYGCDEETLQMIKLEKALVS